MISEYRINELTDIENERYKKFKDQHQGQKVYCYYVTDFNLGVGYDIIVTTIKLNNEIDLGKLNNDNMRNITDIDKLLDNF